MRLALLALVLALAPAARAQGVVLDGEVRSAETNEPLAGATARTLRGTGALADPDGRFRLTLGALPDTVVVRYLGFRPDTLVVTRANVGASGRVARTIRLVPDAPELGRLLVTGGNPAENLLRRVLTRKAALSRAVGAYAAEGYGRLVLERWGLGETRGAVVRVSEALSNVYWRAGAGGREEVVARRRVPEGRPFRYADAEAVPDLFFDDYVWLDGVRYPTPTHPDALDFYAVQMGAVTEENGRRLVDLAIGPRRLGAPGLRGRIRIVDSLFVLAETELRPVGWPGRPYVTGFEATYRVAFAPVESPALGDSVWLPARFEREGRVSAGSAGVQLPDARFRQTTLLTAHRLRADDGPAALWAGDDRYHSPEGAYTGSVVYEPYRLLFPFAPAETAALRRLGPRRLRDLFWREGLLRRFVPVPVEGDDDPPLGGP